ncbi:hypothetical protein AB4142_17585 [Variovorax sp. 2RAF20]
MDLACQGNWPIKGENNVNEHEFGCACAAFGAQHHSVRAHRCRSCRLCQLAHARPAFFVIDDACSGITVIDGQPSFFEAGRRNFGLIRSNRYTNSLPGEVRTKIPLNPPHNSSSYVAGLLKSVTGYVPLVSVPGYQTPGWESPMPAHCYKGEAIR